MAQRLFGTDGLRGRANTYPMTAEIALRLGIAAGVSALGQEMTIARGTPKIDGKIDDVDDFLKDAARELTAVHKQNVASSYCGSVLSDLEKNGFMQRNDDRSLSLSPKGRAALRNIDATKPQTTKSRRSKEK